MSRKNIFLGRKTRIFSFEEKQEYFPLKKNKNIFLGRKTRIFSFEEKQEYYGVVLEKCNQLIQKNKISEVVTVTKQCLEEGLLTIDYLGLLYCHISKTLAEANKLNEVIFLLGDIKRENFRQMIYPMLKGLLGNIYLQKNMYQKSIETFTDALENPIKDLTWNIHYDLGYCYHMIKNYQKAKEHYELCLNLLFRILLR